MKNDKGCTLIETLIALVIAVIIAAGVMFVLSGSRRTSRLADLGAVSLLLRDVGIDQRNVHNK